MADTWYDGKCKTCGSSVIEEASDRPLSDYRNMCTNSECEHHMWHYCGDQEELEYYDHTRKGVTMSEDRDDVYRIWNKQGTVSDEGLLMMIAELSFAEIVCLKQSEYRLIITDLRCKIANMIHMAEARGISIYPVVLSEYKRLLERACAEFIATRTGIKLDEDYSPQRKEVGSDR